MGRPRLGPLCAVCLPSFAQRSWLRPPSLTPEVLPPKARLQVEPPRQSAAKRMPFEWQASLVQLLETQDIADRRRAIAAVRQAKITRASAYAWLRCLDHALALSGSGLVRFIPEEGECICAPLKENETRVFEPFLGEWPFVVPDGRAGRKSIVVDNDTGVKRYELDEFVGPRPTLAVCLDQGSPGWAAGWFALGHTKARLHLAFDIHHRSWNDCFLAMSFAGVKHSVYEYMVVMNFSHGPWESAEWFRVLQQSYDKFLEVADVNDYLFQLLYPGLSRDMGEELG